MTQPDVRAGGCWPSIGRLNERLPGFIQSIGAHESKPQIDSRFPGVWIEFDRTTKVIERYFHTVFLGQSGCQVVVGLGRIRIDLDGLPIQFDCFAERAFAVKRTTPPRNTMSALAQAIRPMSGSLELTSATAMPGCPARVICLKW